MNHGRTISVLFCLLSAFVSFGVTRAEAQLYSGQATGITSTVTINGTPTTTTVADTCPLSITGGSHIATTPAGVIAGLVRTGPITSTASGAGLTSQASANVQNLNITAGGYTVNATSVNAFAQCNCCTPGSPQCGGRTAIVGLTVTGPSGSPIPVVITGSPNQVISLPNGTLTINEQTTSAGAITVNALRLNVTGSNGTNYNVVVASAHADIECTTAGPTAARVTVAGRVLDPFGRGLTRATVRLSGGENTVSTQTGPNGAFSFANIEVGQTYVLQVTSSQYSYAAYTLTLDEETLNIELRPTP